ncbi:MAG: nicotinate (nicotinamide) nucleotide adenylyltransferase [Ignavibacteria bacterium]|nr:nicotinate (nicotinamide) nucleotide adenylyltransferase [Ignavibacteria bacterium]
MSNPSAIGIFGGTFNPIHLGHLIIANFFVSDFHLDFCYFVPNHISPFKIENDEIAPDEQRLEMISLAIKENPKFLVSTFEIEKKGISYSFETVLYFKSTFSQSKLYFLIGSDQIENFTFWKNWETILENAELVVAKRNYRKINIPTNLEPYLKKINFLDNPIIEISSSLIRQLISKNKSIDYLVPNEVRKYIFDNDIYRRKL